MSLTKATYSMILGAPFNVLDYGADPTGVQDSTAAIQACINAASATADQATVIFPNDGPGGFYKTTAPLTLVGGRTHIVGAGIGATQIIAHGLSAGQAVFKYGGTPPSTNAWHWSMSNFTLSSDNGAPDGLWIENGSYIDVHDIEVRNVYLGIRITGSVCFTHSYRRIHGYQIGYSSINIGDNFTGGGQFYISESTLSGPYGFVLNDGSSTDGLCFVNCNFEGNSNNGAYIGGSCNGLSFFGCRTEGGTAYVFVIDPGAGQRVSGITIQGCSFNTGSGIYGSVLFGNVGEINGFNIEGNYLWGTEAVQFEPGTQARSGSICFNRMDGLGTITNTTLESVLVANNSNNSGPIGRKFLNTYPGDYFPVSSGAGTPEGVVTASPGALYVSTTGGAGTTLYVKESGTGNTGWVGK